MITNDMRIRHYIITRFNTPWVNDEQGNPKGLDCDYLKYRFELFDRYTVPSMCYQTCKDFKWIVLYDERTPKEYREKAMSYTELGFYEPIFVKSGFSIEGITNDLIADKNFYYITSRVDNDDALMPDYVECIQNKAKKVFPKDKFITSVRNYRYDVKEKSLTSYKLKKNHFISRTGNVYELGQDAMPVNPFKYAKVAGTHSVEVVHDTNIINSTRYTFRGIIHSNEYIMLRDILNFDLLEERMHRRHCVSCAKKSFFINLFDNIDMGIRIIKKYLKKGIR